MLLSLGNHPDKVALNDALNVAEPTPTVHRFLLDRLATVDARPRRSEGYASRNRFYFRVLHKRAPHSA